MSHMLAVQATMILKKCWFYDLEILELCGQLNIEKYKENLSTRIETENKSTPK